MKQLAKLANKLNKALTLSLSLKNVLKFLPKQISIRFQETADRKIWVTKYTQSTSSIQNIQNYNVHTTYESNKVVLKGQDTTNVLRCLGETEILIWRQIFNRGWLGITTEIKKRAKEKFVIELSLMESAGSCQECNAPVGQ